MTSDTILLRQVHPSFAENGIPTSQAFVPFPKDNSRLSVDDGDLTTAEAAFKYFTEVLRFESIGTWGITCGEVEQIELTSLSDPLKDNPSHAVIDFSDLTEKECRKLAKKLKAFANRRGRLHTA